MEELEITISPTGQVTAKTKGAKGERCMEYAELLVHLLGRQEHLEKTGEFYEREQLLVRQTDVKQRR